LAGSVSRSVYSHFHAPLRTVFAHWGGRPRTVLMRIAAAQAPRRWAQAGNGLISVVFTELARFLLRRS
ncbi:hypothetical protein KIN13_19180, partial [Vibrio cholerae]